MGISLVGSNQHVFGSTAQAHIAIDAGAQSGDLAIYHFYKDQDDAGSIEFPSSFTEPPNAYNGDLGGRDREGSWAYKFLTAGDASVVYTASHSGALFPVSVIMSVWRGVDAVQPLDQSVAAAHTITGVNTAQPPNAAIDTSASAAVVVIMGGQSHSMTTASVGDGFTMVNTCKATHQNLAVAYKTYTAGGAQTPANWQHVGASSLAEWMSWSLALHPKEDAPAGPAATILPFIQNMA